MNITTSLVEFQGWDWPPTEDLTMSDNEIQDVKHLRRSTAVSEAAHKLCGLTPSHRQILSMALRIKEYYKTDFYCFLHGQESCRAPLIWLFKELVKRTNPTRDVKLFKFFRSEAHMTPKPISEFLNAAKIDDHDPLQRADLISVCANFLHTTHNLESPNAACMGNRSICSMKEKEGMQDVLSALNGLSSKKDRDFFSNEFMAIANQFSRSADCGNLAVFCVPKTRVRDWVYRAHPLGSACKCTHPNNDLDILHDAQRDISFNDRIDMQRKGKISFLPQQDCLGINIQYRILASCLKPENMIRSFLLTPNRDAKLACKKAIRELVDKFNDAAQASS